MSSSTSVLEKVLMASIIGVSCQSVDMNGTSNSLMSEKTAGISRQAMSYPSLFQRAREQGSHRYIWLCIQNSRRLYGYDSFQYLREAAELRYLTNMTNLALLCGRQGFDELLDRSYCKVQHASDLEQQRNHIQCGVGTITFNILCFVLEKEPGRTATQSECSE